MILSIDLGDRHVGLAATDVDGKLTYRYGTIDRKAADALEEIKKIVEKESISTLVVGVPTTLEGGESAQTAKTRTFIGRLRHVLPGLAIKEISEVLSSVEARANLKAEGVGDNLEHAEAARILLEDYLKERPIKKQIG
ncbi:MAG: Holliday junction resolvase RuvX [Candidatus Andersenbacteria bacterium]|nr:Holliday junction resolvase RuvX [Candidatus Andersenbacteria bacterium]